MKIKYLFILLTICILTIVIFRVKNIASNDLCFAFIGDVKDFVLENNMCFPQDWPEFLDWYERRHHKSRWRLADIENMFAVPWGMKLSTVVSNNITAITILDKKHKPLEDALNDMFQRQQSVSYMMQNDVNLKKK